MEAVSVLLAALVAVKLADAKQQIEAGLEVTAAFEHLQELRQEADGAVGHEDH